MWKHHKKVRRNTVLIMDLLQLFRKLKKPKSQPQGLDLELTTSPTEEAVSELKKAKFRLRKPRVTSPTEKRIVRKKPQSLQSSAASATSSEVVRCSRAGSPFADEDDLFADRDDGVYMQSSSSSASPAASERLARPKSRGGHARPASCTFGSSDAKFGTTFHHNSRGMKANCYFSIRNSRRLTNILHTFVIMNWNQRWLCDFETTSNELQNGHLYAV